LPGESAVTIPFLIHILFAFFLVDVFIITVWAAIELVDEIRKRIRETPEDGDRKTEDRGQKGRLAGTLAPPNQRMEDGL
jgi:hypothetical protein